MLRLLQYSLKENSWKTDPNDGVILSSFFSWKKRQGCIQDISWKVKMKLSLCFNWASSHEGVLGSGGIAPRILNLGTGWRWVVSFTLQPLYFRGKSPWYLLDRRLAGPQSRSGHGDEEKNSEPLPGLESPIIQPIAQRYTTELFRLL
jgi:hypothetical protein